MFTVMDQLLRASFNSLKVAKFWKTVGKTNAVHELKLQKHWYAPLNVENNVLGTKHLLVLFLPLSHLFHVSLMMFTSAEALRSSLSAL